MNELVRDTAPRFVPTKFDHGPIRTAPRRAVTIFFSRDYSLRIRSHFGDMWNLNAKILSVSHPLNQGAIYIQTLDQKLLSWMSSLNLYLHHHRTNTQISLTYMVLHIHQLNPLLYLLTGFRNYYWIWMWKRRQVPTIFLVAFSVSYPWN